MLFARCPPPASRQDSWQREEPPRALPELTRLSKLLLVLVQLKLLQLLKTAIALAAMFLLPLPAAAYRPLLPSELRRLKSDRYAVIPLSLIHI